MGPVLAELAVDYSSETSLGEKAILWSIWLGNLGLMVSCVPLLQVLFQLAQLLGVSPQTGHASHLLDHGPLSPGPIQEVGSKSTSGKTDSNTNSPLPSACCVLGTVPSGLRVIAHVISPPSPSMRWALFYCVHFIERKPEVWACPWVVQGPIYFVVSWDLNPGSLALLHCRAATLLHLPHAPAPSAHSDPSADRASAAQGPRVNEGQAGPVAQMSLLPTQHSSLETQHAGQVVCFALGPGEGPRVANCAPVTEWMEVCEQGCRYPQRSVD